MNNQLRMILLMGMKSNLTMYPIPPMMANPMAHEVAIFLNSSINQHLPLTSGFSQTYKKRLLYPMKPFTPYTAPSIYLFIN